jgi:hypothetical protein
VASKGERLRTGILVIAIMIGFVVQAPEQGEKEAVALENSPTIRVEPLPTL